MRIPPRRSTGPRALDLTFQSLIAPLSVARFLGHYWQRRPHFVPGARHRLSRIGQLLRYQSVPQLLEENPVRRVSAWYRDLRGAQRSIDVEPATALKLFEAGMTLYFDLEEVSPPMRAWRDQIASELGVPKNGRVSIFASKKSGGTPNHFDANHNFTIQLSGAKRWQIAANPYVENPTDNWGPGRSRSSELALYSAAEFPRRMPRSAKRLELSPGAMLYLPPGYLHQTRAESESISLNISFRPPTWADVVSNALRARLLEDPRWRTSAGPSRSKGDIEQLLQSTHRSVDELRVELKPEPRRAPISETSPFHRNRLVSCTFSASDRRNHRGRLMIKHPAFARAEYSLQLDQKLLPVIRWVARTQSAFTFTQLRARFSQWPTTELRRLFIQFIEAGWVQ